MKFKHIILGSILWRSLYFLTTLLLNIIVARYLQASGSGWIYYITNFFSFVLLVASLNLEAGTAFYASKKMIAESKLTMLSLLWSIFVSALITGLVFLNYQHPSQEITRTQFVFFAVTYVTGTLLNTFFSALFYAQQRFALPNLLLSVTNILLVATAIFIFYFEKGSNAAALFLRLYFFNFLLQGVLLFAGYSASNRLSLKWSFPNMTELRMLFRYAALALMANIVFFLLYRVDYWFIKNTCTSCGKDDLGNYIQVSKLGQMFLLVPTFIASTLSPRTSAGFREEVNLLLPRISGLLFFFNILILSIIVVTGRWLFTFVFGETFDQMYYPFLLLMPGILSLTSTSVIAAYYAGKNKVIVNLTGAFFALIVVVTGDILFIPRFGIRGAALISSIGYSTCYFYLLFVFKKEYSVPVKSFFTVNKEDLKKIYHSLTKQFRAAS